LSGIVCHTLLPTKIPAYDSADSTAKGGNCNPNYTPEIKIPLKRPMATYPMVFRKTNPPLEIIMVHDFVTEFVINYPVMAYQAFRPEACKSFARRSTKARSLRELEMKT
jgi:hypothetical protein